MLFSIAAKIRANIANRNRGEWEKQIFELLSQASATRSLRDALRRPELSYILEIKKTSPSTDGTPLKIDVQVTARLYQECGADCISVLTEENHFAGSLDDLQKVRECTSLPLLRKDFIIDELQIVESRAHGADAILLIVSLLSDKQLLDFLATAQSNGLDALVEVHSESELRRAVGAGAEIIGVNNRNLKTMAIDLQQGARLLKMIPSSCVSVAESGIAKKEDVLLMRDAGADALLIGTSVVRAEDIRGKIRELMVR